MTAPTQIHEGFSISHAQVLDGATSFEEAVFALYDEDLDIYGVSDASLEPDTDSYDNPGDDVIMSVWDWLNKVTVSLQAGYMSFPLLSNITGRPVTLVSTGPNQVQKFDLWHEDDFNVSAKPLLLKMPSKDSKGQAGDLVIGIFSFRFGALTFDGPANKDGLRVNYNGTGVYSLYDEEGNAFPDGKKRIARAVRVGRAAPTP